MQSVYDNVKNHVIKLITKYRYEHIKGPLTDFNLSTLVEISIVADTSKIYHVLNKLDMETRINLLSIMQHLANPYTIDNKKPDYVYCIYRWEDYTIFNNYRRLKEKEKQAVWKQLLKDEIFFECLSPDLLLLGFKLDRKYG
jgi:hypothetical protein